MSITGGIIAAIAVAAAVGVALAAACRRGPEPPPDGDLAARRAGLRYPREEATDADC